MTRLHQHRIGRRTGVTLSAGVALLAVAYTPVPASLESFGGFNPISTLATASRGLMESNAHGSDILIVLATAAVLTAVFVPLTTRLYRSR